VKERTILFLLVIFSLLLIVLRLNFNGIFVDEEAYISVGHHVVAGDLKALVGNPLEWMFGFHIAPVLIYIGELAGGLLAARMINSVFAIGTMLIAYFITKRLFNDKKTSVISFLLTLFFAPIFFVARFATFDSSSIFFAALSLYLTILAVEEKNKRKSIYEMLAASIILFISFLCKYTSILMFPALFLIVLFRKRKESLHFIIPYSALVLNYLIVFSPELRALFSSQLSSQTGFASYTLMLIINLLLPYTILALFSPRKSAYLAFFMIGAVSVVAFQLSLNNFLNTFKHMAFSFIFIVPFAAAGMSNLLSKSRKKWIFPARLTRILGISLFLALMLFISIIFVFSSYGVEKFYINEESGSKVLDSLVNTNDYVLVEGSAFRYYTKKLSYLHVVTNFWFDYNHDGTIDENDYRSAIQDSYFKAIMTTTIKSKFDIAKYLEGSPYKLVYEEEQNLSSGASYLRIYTLNATPLR
jgi:4-amino-4-deoxy-L-arabinose transferase-like glycosyltransferase